ncbi:MAG: hypothetical protein KDN22_11690 [Verrucomicrobiae bacterium]|nr:hypothetical protein [Verrucomicrobiae bacterium]
MLFAALWLVAVAVVAFSTGWLAVPAPVSGDRIKKSAPGIPMAEAGNVIPGANHELDWSAFLFSVKQMTTEECIAALGAEADREEIERLRFLDWARRDPVAAIIAAGEDQEKRRDAFWTAAESKPQEALDFLKQHTELPLEGNILARFIGRWAKRDIEAVKEAMMDPYWRTLVGADMELLADMTSKIGGYWPKDDPTGWVRWIAEVGMTDPRQFAYLSEICLGRNLDTSQIRSLTTFAEMPPGLQRDAALAVVCEVIPTNLAMSALDLVSSENRVMVAASIAKAMNDPVEAMQWFAELAPRDPPAEGSLFDKYSLPIGEWLSSPVPGGIEHLSEWPAWLRDQVVESANGALSGELALAFSAPEAIAEKVQEWAHEDAEQTEAASQWIGSIDPADPGRDAAIVGLVRGVANEDPGGAYAWAQSIADPVLRERQLRVTISLLAERDAAAAQVALEDARGGGMLSADALASLTEEIQGRAEEGTQ